MLYEDTVPVEFKLNAARRAGPSASRETCIEGGRWRLTGGGADGAALVWLGDGVGAVDGAAQLRLAVDATGVTAARHAAVVLPRGTTRMKVTQLTHTPCSPTTRSAASNPANATHTYIHTSVSYTHLTLPTILRV